MPKPDQSLPVSSGIRSFFLGDELLLFSPHVHALFRLNPSAAFIWCCCEEGLDRPAIVEEMVQTFQLATVQAEQDLEATLFEWKQRGLLGRTEESSVTATGQVPVDDEPVPEPQTRTHDFPVERHYRMFETVFRLRFTDTTMASCADSAFAHLGVDADCPFDVSFDLQHDARGYFLFGKDKPIAWCRHEQELAPLLHGQVVADAYERANCLISFHAGAVSNGRECLIFPALSGSGKSTLTAALVASGFSYCTDELVLLQAQTHLVQTIAAGIGIKSGSWDVLQPFYPHIMKLPAHRRLDGQAVRYLLPTPDQLSDDMAQHHPIRALVFPAYQPDTEPCLERLTPANALCRLTEAGTDMDGELDDASVTELVDWIADMDSYELRYSKLEDAIAHVRELLS